MSKKIVMLLVTVTVITLSLTGCGFDAGVMSSGELIGNMECDGQLKMIAGDEICQEYVDVETGVHYWYCAMGGLTPRYNADGTLMVDGE